MSCHHHLKANHFPSTGYGRSEKESRKRRNFSILKSDEKIRVDEMICPGRCPRGTKGLHRSPCWFPVAFGRELQATGIRDCRNKADSDL
ncbi:hypothetical protein CDAR_435651 [Caerostris darwini]|uniref:Uncharacterized protein n=1 Tax=Caerostris darwini TaxID=1538125 RepID=A0AAV4P799_9ARAC|nr:hypothetical protein CDAR_435651 [Caerostris darwini]